MSWRREPVYLKKAKPLEASSASDWLAPTFLPPNPVRPVQVLRTGCVTYGAVSSRYRRATRASAGTIA